MDDGSLIAQLFKLATDTVCAVLGAREDEVGSLFFLQHLVEQTKLLVLHDGVGAQFDALVGLGCGADLDANRLLHIVAHDLGDVGIERGGVAHGLTRFGQSADDAADGGQEAHVEHAIHFVQDEHLDVFQVDLATLEVVLKTAGRGDDEARAATQSVKLCAFAEAAADEHRV